MKVDEASGDPVAFHDEAFIVRMRVRARAAPMAVRVRQLAESDLEDFRRYTATHWSPGQTDRYHSDLIATRTRRASYREGRPYLPSAWEDFPVLA
ncbi:hypothetical protein PTKU15_88410 [Paraburkholderia terrae]|nr:hypothetical protein PTKU15_88410 [Paraburkholderia terrae]